MSNNCLLTKLKGEVQNDTLQKLGVLRIHVPSNSTHALIRFFANKDVSVDVYGNGGFSYFNESPDRTQTHKVCPANYQADISLKKDVDFYLEISDKYALKSLSFLNDNGNLEIDLSEISYCTELETLNIKGKYGTSSRSTGSISELKRLTKLETIELAWTDCNGDVSTIGALYKLTYLNVYDSKVSGNIEDLLNAVASSKENGDTLRVYSSASTPLRYNNATFDDVTFTFDGNGGWSKNLDK